MTRDILETIGHVIDDWETSQDAMRWLPEVPPEPEEPALVIYDQPNDLAWVALHAALVEAMRPVVEYLVAEMDAVARAVSETLSRGWQLPHLSWGFSFVDPSPAPIPVLAEVAIRDAVEHFGDVAWTVQHEGWLPGRVSVAEYVAPVADVRGQRSPGPVSQRYSRRGLHQ